MRNSVAIIQYCGDGNVKNSFEKLKRIFLTDYSDENIYGIVFDLPPSVSYISSNDRLFEESIRECMEELITKYGDRFFCAVRPRRYLFDKKKTRYAVFKSKDGELGAKEDISAYMNGNKSVFISAFGTTGILKCEKLRIVSSAIKVNESKSKVCYKHSDNEVGSDFINKVSICAYKSISGILENGEWTIYSGKTLTYIICAIVSAKLFGYIGAKSACEFVETLLLRLKFAVQADETECSDGEASVLLTALISAFKALGDDYPSFYLMASDASEIRRLLFDRVRREKSNGIGAICYKEFPIPGNEGSIILTSPLDAILVGAKGKGLLELVRGRSGRENIFYNALILIYSAELSLNAPFFNFLKKDEVFRARYGYFVNRNIKTKKL